MDLRHLWALTPLVRSHRWAVPALVLLGVAGALAEGVGIGMLIPFFGMLLEGGTVTSNNPAVRLLQEYASGLDARQRIWVLTATMFVLILLKSILLYAATRMSAWVSGWISHGFASSFFSSS